MKRLPKPGEIWKYKAVGGTFENWHMLILRYDNPLYLVLNLGYLTNTDYKSLPFPIGSIGHDYPDGMEFVQ